MILESNMPSASYPSSSMNEFLDGKILNQQILSNDVYYMIINIIIYFSS